MPIRLKINLSSGSKKQINKEWLDICKNSKDYVGFSYPGIVLPYRICLFPLIPYS